MIIGSRAQIEFITKVQRILDEGDFSSTYKYALLLALADLCVELGSDTSASLNIRVDQISEKFIQYYWKQALPFPSNNNVLFQNSGRQAAIITKIRNHNGQSFSLFKLTSDWPKLIKEVSRQVKLMPLWRLQKVGGKVTDFLYPHELNDDSIQLRAGCSFCFRKFHGLIKHLVQGAWVNWVNSASNNRTILGPNFELHSFLFGCDRHSLDVYKKPLFDIQGSKCFYCNKNMKISTTQVDHFIPWSNYPVDLGHNFVLAHGKCNKDKRDFLPHTDYLSAWVQRNENTNSYLVDFFNDHNLPYNLESSCRIAEWAYGHAEGASYEMWHRKIPLTTVDSRWRNILRTCISGFNVNTR